MLVFLLLQVSFAFAGTTASNIGSMFVNFESSAYSIINLIQKASLVIGLFLIFGSVLKFIEVANGKAQIRTPLIMFLAGIGCFMMLSSLDVITNTLSMGSKVSNPGDVLMSAGGTSSGSAAIIKSILVFVQMVGALAFVRGWLLINQYAQQAREGILGRALTHLFGGALAINIKWSAAVLLNTFAPGLPSFF